MDTVLVPTVNQVTPSEDCDAVKVLPVRCSLNQTGTQVNLSPVTQVIEPPALDRVPNSAMRPPIEPWTIARALALELSDSRIITPVLLKVPLMFASRAVRVKSPVTLR